MSTIMPQNELHRRAMQWIADEQREHPEKKLHSLIDEAGMRFNLGPQDCRFLLELLGRPASPNPLRLLAG